MKVKPVLTTALAGMALAVPGASSATAAPVPPPPPPQDTVDAVQRAFICADLFPFGEVCDTYTATIHGQSGARGEDPTGTVIFSFFGFDFPRTVTCLRVEGNRAMLEIDRPGPLLPVSRFSLEDGPVDLWANLVGVSSCTDPFVDATPVGDGFVEIHDAPSVPQTRNDCKDGSWQYYGFRSRGRCVAFVQRGVK